MNKVKVQQLTVEAFKTFGVYADMIGADTVKIGKPPIEFFRDMALLNLGHTNLASFSVVRVKKRPLLINTLECHSYCSEGILPLDGDVLIFVGHATPKEDVPLGSICVFRVPKGTFVSLNPGVWHHAPFTPNNDCVNVLIVLPERTYANDCFVVNLDEEDSLEIDIS